MFCFKTHFQNSTIKESGWPKVFCEKGFLEILQNSQENTCVRVSFLIKLQVLKKETLTQVFSCEFCEISKNTFFREHLWATAFLNCAVFLHHKHSRGVLKIFLVSSFCIFGFCEKVHCSV